MMQRKPIRNEIILKEMLQVQKEINDALSKFKITTALELDQSDPVVRRGLIHSSGDMFELSKKLSDTTADKVGINNQFIKAFRNKVAHNYGEIGQREAYTWIKHCASKDVKKNIRNTLDEIVADETAKNKEKPSLRDTLAVNQAKADRYNTERKASVSKEKDKHRTLND